MNFEVKQDGRRKARLVAGGHLVDPMGITSRSTVVKAISVRLPDLIAHRDNLPVLLCGNIGNAFITAQCMEKIFTHAGSEFGEREGSVLIFKEALYGLRSSSRAFRAHFAVSDFQLRATTVTSGCASEKRRTASTTSAHTWMISKSLQETRIIGNHISLAHSYTNRLVPQSIIWVMTITIQKRRTHGS